LDGTHGKLMMVLNKMSSLDFPKKKPMDNSRRKAGDLNPKLLAQTSRKKFGIINVFIDMITNSLKIH
jgi:hypothetical protein